MKLPIGSKARLVGISYTNDQVKFGLKEIEIGQNNIEALVLSNTTTSEVKSRIETLN